VAHGLEKLAVFIDGIGTHEYEKVSGHVAKHKADQKQASDAHEKLAANRAGGNRDNGTHAILSRDQAKNHLRK
jgi:hypothetical protein